MGTGYTRNDTANNIADGNIINASDLDGEFDAVESAFKTDGHTHDGSASEGGAITVIGPVQDVLVSAISMSPKTDDTLSLGTPSLRYKNLYLSDTLTTDGDVIINGSLTVEDITSGSITLGDITIDSGGINFPDGNGGSIELNDVFVNVSGDVMTGDLGVDADFVVTGTSSLKGTDVDGNLTITGDILADKDATIGGDVTITGDTLAEKDVSVGGNLSVTGVSTLPIILQNEDININAGPTANIRWLTGDGEPEGVVEASVGSLYANTSASPGAGTLFMKTSGDGTIGWEEAGSGAGGPVDPGDGTNALFTETFEGDGVNNTVTLNNEPASINNTQVYISGVYQLKNTYSLANKVITFTEIPPDGRSIEVVIASSVTFEDSEFVNQSGDTMTGALKIEDNLEVTGETNTGTLVVGSGVTIDAILDEDDMVSDSDTAVPTQQSVKKYVDDSATGGMFIGNNGIIGTGIDDIFRVNAQSLNVDVTIGSDQNASCTGPLAIATGVILTVTTGGNLAII